MRMRARGAAAAAAGIWHLAWLLLHGCMAGLRTPQGTQGTVRGTLFACLLNPVPDAGFCLFP
jgi:hypothetical protein